jgi:hypothetical protein
LSTHISFLAIQPTNIPVRCHLFIEEQLRREPSASLRQIARLLKSNGILILLTGNGGDLVRQQYSGKLDLPDHLVFAGEDSLTAVLGHAGFTLLAK